MQLNKKIYNNLLDIKKSFETSFPDSKKGKGLVDTNINDFRNQRVTMFISLPNINYNLVNKPISDITRYSNIVICPKVSTDENDDTVITIDNECFYSNYNLDDPTDSNIVKNADIVMENDPKNPAEINYILNCSLSYSSYHLRVDTSKPYFLIPIGNLDKGYSFQLKSNLLQKGDVIVNKYLSPYSKKISLFGNDKNIQNPEKGDVNYTPVNDGEYSIIPQSNGTFFDNKLYFHEGYSIKSLDIAADNTLLYESTITPIHNLDPKNLLKITDKYVLFSAYDDSRKVLVYDRKADGTIDNERIIHVAQTGFGDASDIFGNTIICGIDHNNMYTYTIADDGTIKNTQTFKTPNNDISTVAINDKNIYIGRDAYIYIYDIADDGTIGNERTVSKDDNDFGNKIALFGKTLITTSSNGLYMYNIADDGTLTNEKICSDIKEVGHISLSADHLIFDNKLYPLKNLKFV